MLEFILFIRGQEMLPIREFLRPSKRSILFLMALVILSSMVMLLVKNLSDWNTIRTRRTFLANHAVELREIMESHLAKASTDVEKEWFSRTVQHYRDLEAKYRQGASSPWKSLPPDPMEPDPPSVKDIVESAEAEAKKPEI